MSRNKGDSYLVSGVCCSTEEAVLRKALDRALGEAGAYEFNPLTCELRVKKAVAADRILHALRVAGFGGRLRTTPEEEEKFLARHGEGITAAVAALLALAGILLGGTASRVLLGAAVVIGGWRIARRALGSLRTRALDMNVLMCAAVAGALAIDRWEEGASVIVLYALSLVLESYSLRRTRAALHALVSLSPDSASVVRGGAEEVVPVREVVPGEVIVVRPGERVALDGVVVEGDSEVDESQVTGESVPVPKGAGGTVYAGSMNGTGVLRVRATRDAGDSTIARVAALVAEAQKRRAPVQGAVDSFARVYTPLVMALALLVAAVPPLLLGGPFTPWLYRALVLLVIACPCALVIATPVAFVSALTRGARRGVLIRGGRHLEALARVRALALDKTGTLTAGRMTVTDIAPMDSLTKEEALALVAALEQNSEHHLAAATRRAVGEARGLPAVEGFTSIPGAGVRGVIGGRTYYLGSRALSLREGFHTSAVEEALERFDSEGKTSVILGSAGAPVCVVAFRDDLRHGGREAMARLRKQGIRRLVMLSGDRAPAARSVAARLGIEEVRAGLLPEEKVGIIAGLKEAEGQVAMVGDGINDAPALAASDVGIAMGISGADAALDSADVVLMSEDLAHLSFARGLSRATVSIVRQNIALAVAVKFVFLLLALGGVATLWMAVLSDDGAALAVILNALRILGYRENT